MIKKLLFLSCLLIGIVPIIFSQKSLIISQLKPNISEGTKKETPDNGGGFNPIIKPKEEIFTQLNLTSDLPGTVYVNDSSHILVAGIPLSVSVPRSYNVFFVTQDKVYETETHRENLRANNKDVQQSIDFQLAEKYEAYKRGLSEQAFDATVLKSIKSDFITIVEETDYQRYHQILFGTKEVTVAQYALYKRANERSTTSRSNESSIVDVSRKLELKRVTKAGVDWQHDAIGNLIEDPSNSDLPVVNVSWAEAKAFCTWMNEQDLSYTYRLPTKREWIYFAQCGEYEYPYPWGAAKDGYKTTANLRDNSLKTRINARQSKYENYIDGFAFASPVASFEPNCYGLYDMAGNVAEWLEDRYNSRNISEETIKRLFIGGSYYTPAAACKLDALKGRVPKGLALAENARNSGIGFRLVKEAK